MHQISDDLTTPPSSVLRPPSSVLRPPSSVLPPPSSVLPPPSSLVLRTMVLHVLFSKTNQLNVENTNSHSLYDITHYPSAFKNRKISLYLAGKPYWKGRLCTVDLLVLTSLNQFFYILNIIYFLTKHATLIRRSTVLFHPLQLVFPAFGIDKTI